MRVAARPPLLLRAGLVRRARRACAAWLAPLLALCVLAGALAKSEHDAAFRHVRCAEHGELTHVASTSASTEACPPLVQGGLREGERSGQPEHEHCPVASAAGAAAAWTCIALTAPYTPPALPEPLGTPRLAAEGRVAHLASAPKTSPPC